MLGLIVGNNFQFPPGWRKWCSGTDWVVRFDSHHWSCITGPNPTMEINKYFPFRNCSTVFRIAEESLGIPSLLDPVDMAECDSPDRLSILTYLSEFYHTFKAEKSPPVSKKKKEEDRLGSSDLKRKDSCDSGVSVSPLGSVCNSPPPCKKEPAVAAPVTPAAPVVSTPPSPPSLVKSEVPPPESPGLDSLLRQRLNISLSSPQSKLGLTPPSCEKERRNLLKSMISVSGADISRNTKGGEETSRVPDSKPDRPDRRLSLDPSFLTQRALRDSQPSGTSSGATGSSRFVSCTRISLSPSNPVKYARNNSVSCDVVTTGAPGPPRPWRESNPPPGKNSAISVPLAGGVQLNVNSGQTGENSRSASFKSKMLKFERMMSAGAGSQERHRGNLTCNQENNPFPSAARDVRRKSISFPPSFTVSLSSSEDSKLTF